MTEIEKPPLGVMPRRYWLEQRANELSRAIRDYVVFIGKGYSGNNWGLVGVWSAELRKVAEELHILATEDAPL